MPKTPAPLISSGGQVEVTPCDDKEAGENGHPAFAEQETEIICIEDCTRGAIHPPSRPDRCCEAGSRDRFYQRLASEVSTNEEGGATAGRPTGHADHRQVREEASPCTRPTS